MFHNGFRKCCTVVLALLLCQSAAFARTGMGKPSHTVYVMRVDYNPKIEQLTGLCYVNGHPCWLVLDTGWVGVALFADRQADWDIEKPGDLTTPQVRKQDRKKGTRFITSVRLGPLDFFPDEVPVDVIEDTKHYRTSTGQSITGIIGIPFLNLLPTEWNVPKHKIVFWLHGRPKQFRHLPLRASIICKQDRVRHLLIPITVHGRHGEICFDTGADEVYIFDKLISNFPAVGAEGVATGIDSTIHCVPREVEGLRIGPLTYNGIILGRLSASSLKGTPFAYGSLGMSVISHLHLFVVGNKIIFDPHINHFLSSR